MSISHCDNRAEELPQTQYCWQCLKYMDQAWLVLLPPKCETLEMFVLNSITTLTIIINIGQDII